VIEELERTPMPGRIRALPRTKAGYPVPYFAVEVEGVRDFRAATRAEVMASIDSGYPLLDAQCDLDDDPEDSRRLLRGEYERALRYLPVAG
jgi:hypothetical protein